MDLAQSNNVNHRYFPILIFHFGANNLVFHCLILTGFVYHTNVVDISYYLFVSTCFALFRIEPPTFEESIQNFLNSNYIFKKVL